MIAIVLALVAQAGEWEELRAIWRDVRSATHGERVKARIERHFEHRGDPVSMALNNLLLRALPEPQTAMGRTPVGMGVYMGSTGSNGDDMPEEGMGGRFRLPLVGGPGCFANFESLPWDGYWDNYDPSGPWAVHHVRSAVEGLPAWLGRRLLEILRALDGGEAPPEFDAPTAGERKLLTAEVARLAEDDIDARDAAEGSLLYLAGAGLPLLRSEAVVTFLLDELDRATDPEVRSRLKSILDRL